MVGFIAAWRPGTFPELSHKTTVLVGRLDLGEAGIRIAGVLWLLMAVCFAGVGVIVWMRGSSAVGAILWAATASAVLCVFEWPDSQIGVVVNLGIVLLALAALRFGWFEAASAR
jgi:hypothetical protein